MSDLPSYHCQRAQSPLVPNAATDGAPWRTATWITQFQQAGSGDALAPERYLRAALLWDDTCLYAAWESAPSLVPVHKTRRDDDLWEECTVELFLAAGQGYYEIEINPRGAVLDLHFPDEEEDDWRKYRTWDAAGMTWAVHPPSEDGRQAWTAELRLPWTAVPELTRETVDGGIGLRAQVCRSQRCADGTFELPAWGPVQRRFCERRAMGHIILVDG